jgi:hypothetical protein
VLGGEAHDTTAPLPPDLVVPLVELALGGVDEVGELGLVLLADAGEGDARGGLLAHNLAKDRLGADDAVRDLHLAAEGGEPDDELDGVNVGGDDDEDGLLGLDEGGDVVQTELDNDGLLAGAGSTLLGAGLLLGLSDETSLENKEKEKE